jgi:hypothetical protein
VRAASDFTEEHSLPEQWSTPVLPCGVFEANPIHAAINAQIVARKPKKTPGDTGWRKTRNQGGMNEADDNIDNRFQDNSAWSRGTQVFEIYDSPSKTLSKDKHRSGHPT